MTVTQGSRFPSALRPRRGLPNLGIVAALEAEQDRWFLWVPVLFGLGIGLYFVLPDEPALWPLLPLTALAAMAYLLLRSRGLAIVAGAAVLATIAGFTAIKLRTETQRAPVLERSVGPVAVEGWVELIEARPKRGERLTIRVQRINDMPPETWPVRVRVRTQAVDDRLQPGDGIRVNAMLSPPGEPALPGDYDFARAAWFQQIGAVGYTREAIARVDLGMPPLALRWRIPIERLRQHIGQRIAAALPGETGAIATALITGERGGITDATNDAFRDSGLLHILSISGLHMVIMAGAVFLLVRFLLSLWPWLALRFPIKKWAATAAALAALGYLLISGASFPTVRSYIMITIMYLAVLLDRPAVALRTVAVAALLILVVWPESLIDVSFQMSFAAVIGLVAAYEILREREVARAERRGGSGLARQILRLGGGILVSTLIASIAVAPLAAYHFHKSQQYAMIANLMAIPICNLIVMPMALATLVAMPFGLEVWPLAAMGRGIEAMVWCAYKVASLPGAVTRIAAIPTSAFVLFAAGGLWIALWRHRPRWFGLIAVLAGLALAPTRAAPDMLVNRDGSLIAVRGADRKLIAIGSRTAAFDLTRWLEHDGDDRRAEVLLAQPPSGLACDWQGCMLTARGKRIAIARHAAALADDCRGSDILVAPIAGPLPETCRHDPADLLGGHRPALAIDRPALARHGTHVIYIDRQGGVAHTTVDAWRGRRPWSDQSETRLAARQSRLRFWRPRSATPTAQPPLPTLRSTPAPGDPELRQDER